MSETIDSLTVYCRDNKRVCPLPKAWQQLWEMLPEKRRTVDAWEPAIPLIGAAWHDATAMLKMVRLAEHLQWAAKHNALSEVAAFLRGSRRRRHGGTALPASYPAKTSTAYCTDVGLTD
ncbi:MAG: hypothetical protein E6G76_24645 [Alphaproteobacteria bacterium]|nr:MAG: hypothetical protein E6G76_24645 [Alphaproteobacteria bacterium]